MSVIDTFGIMPTESIVNLAEVLFYFHLYHYAVNANEGRKNECC